MYCTALKLHLKRQRQQLRLYIFLFTFPTKFVSIYIQSNFSLCHHIFSPLFLLSMQQCCADPPYSTDTFLSCPIPSCHASPFPVTPPHPVHFCPIHTDFHTSSQTVASLSQFLLVFVSKLPCIPSSFSL